MCDKELPNYIQDLLDRVCKENGFVNYSVQVKKGTQDGFTSELLSVEISENASEKCLNVVCKMAPNNDNLQKEIFSDMVFDREITFYEKVMPYLVKFQEEKNLPKEDQFLVYPKCYGTFSDPENAHYVIIMEDLQPSGFKHNKAKAASVECMQLAMRELGKFHGVSIAMKDQRPDLFGDFQKFGDLWKLIIQPENLHELFETSYDQAIEALWREEHKQIMRDMKANMMAYFDSCIGEEVSNRFGVLSHGDFWINNIMYSFDDNGIADDIRVLDWQVIRYASPAADLIYCLFSSTDKALRDKEYDNLIEIYYNSLSKTVKLLGSNPDELFTFDDLQDELRICGNFALLTTPNMIQVCFDDELTDLEAGDSGQEFISGLNAEAQQKYAQRLNDVFEDIIKLGYYRKVE